MRHDLGAVEDEPESVAVAELIGHLGELGDALAVPHVDDALPDRVLQPAQQRPQRLEVVQDIAVALKGWGFGISGWVFGVLRFPGLVFGIRHLGIGYRHAKHRGVSL